MGITVVIGSFRLNAVVCLFTLAITGSYADGAERFVDSPILGGDSPGPCCGLYSAARLASLLPDEQDIDLRPHASVRYVGSAAGSTAAQISDMLQESGIEVIGLRGLSKTDLLASSVPWIANVRQYPDSSVYNHWVCIHPSGTKIAVYDGADGPKYVNVGEFLAVWNIQRLFSDGRYNDAILDAIDSLPR